MLSQHFQMRIDFQEFSDYLDKYSSIVEGTKPLFDLVNIYYQGTELENFNTEEFSKFATKFLDYQGNSIVNKNNMKCLSLARDFALSNDPQKRQTYLCTVEVEMLFDDGDEMNMIAKVKANGISATYLKSVGLYEEEDYEEYLADKSSEVVYHKFFKGEYESGHDRLIKYKLI